MATTAIPMNKRLGHEMLSILVPAGLAAMMIKMSSATKKAMMYVIVGAVPGNFANVERWD